ncbi:MAG: nuclear transport factor 2 family protein [Agarilytica sp.]
MINTAKEFFQIYNETFDSGDMEAFSKLFNEPFLSVRPDGSVESMTTNNLAKDFFTKVLALWKNEGYKYFATKDYDVTPIGNKSMLVTLTWELLDKNRALIREWRQSYNLLDRNGEWKVITSTFHDA